MPNSITTYTDAQILRALLTRNFSGIGGELIDDTVTAVKPAAFMAAQNLTKVSLSALKTVRTMAFQDTNITTLDLPWSSLESIGYCAFYGAQNLPQNLTLSAVTALSNGAFAGTSSARNTQIRSVSLPLWTGSAMTEGSGFSNSNMGIFAYCSAMTSFSAPELLTVPYQMLYYCAALEEVVLPKVTSLGNGCFNYCSNLKKIDIGGAVTRISNAFISMTEITSPSICRIVNSLISTICFRMVRSSREHSLKSHIAFPRLAISLRRSLRRWHRTNTEGSLCGLCGLCDLQANDSFVPSYCLFHLIRDAFEM